MFLLEGELSYPNLQISPTQLDFKCVLVDTSKKEYLRLRNTNELPVTYHWEFFEEVIEKIKEEPEEEQKKTIKKSSKPKILTSDLFDILPINGVLQPGEEETVEVTFHSLVKSLRQTFAKCIVEGGPEYVVSFKGEAAELAIPVLDEVLDFGSIPYCDEARNSFRIKNDGKVGFEYFISLEKLSRPEIFKIEKQSGIIGPDDSEKIDIRLKLGIPCEFQEKLLVYIGHLEPKEVLVTAVGLFPFLVFSVRRSEREKFAQKVQEIVATTEKPSQCLCSLDDVQKTLSKKQENINRSQISVVLRPQPVIAEAEVDRRELCFNILEVRL
jgi:hydrocephalus-inducing protein